MKGKWLAREGGKMTVWTDASNLALGVVITIDDVVVEDAAWLRKTGDSSRINLSKLDAAIRGINMAIRLKVGMTLTMCAHMHCLRC